MELFNDWGSSKHVEPEPRSQRAVSSSPASVDEILGGLAKFEEHIINVHCYEDVGYPWVQVVFNKVINPDVALGIGDALVAVAGADRVYFNSLRPKAVYFVLEPALNDPPPDLPASRYGASLAEVREAWKPT